MGTAEVRRVEHLVDAWLEGFIEDIAPQFPSVSRKREFGMRILNVFLERSLAKESASQPNRLVTIHDKCVGPDQSTLGSGGGGVKDAWGARIPPRDSGPKMATFGTQTILERDLREAQVR